MEHIDTAIGVFKGDTGARSKIDELIKQWHRCRYGAPRLVGVAETELRFQQKTEDPLDAYRMILLQEYVER